MKSIFETYTLSAQITEKLINVRNIMEGRFRRANPTWKDIGTEITNDSSLEGNKDKEVISETQIIAQVEPQFSIQVNFSQLPEESSKKICEAHESLDFKDIVESIYEGLERTNGNLELGQLQALSNVELKNIVSELNRRLSTKGIYNLCCSLTRMNDEEKARYINLLCTNLLLPKISNLEESSLLLPAAMKECAEKIPDDMQQYVFVPLLNSNISDTTLISTFLNSISLQRKKDFLMTFCIVIKELKEWHISILYILLTTKIDPDTKDCLISLLSQKALCFCKDKNYGKTILLLLKAHQPFSSKQVDLLQQVVAVNETVYRRPLENLLRNL